MRLHQLATSVAAVAFSAVTLAAAPATASAQLFDTGIGNSTTFRSAGRGPGQGIAVTTTTQLSSFGFYLGTGAGTTLKYFIFNGANDALLYTQTQTYATGLAAGTLAMTDPLNFTLDAGQTYYFGVTGNGAFNASYFFPPIEQSQNGLALVNPNTNYDGFDSPAYSDMAAATIALQLNGSQGITTTPEPGTWALLGTGLVTLAGVTRRRRNATA